MKLKSFLFFFILFFGGFTLFAQQKEIIKSENINLEVKSTSEHYSLPSSAEIGDKPLQEKYHQLGVEAEKKLNESDKKNDQQIGVKDFIIERSPNIKIEYRPDPKNRKN